MLPLPEFFGGAHASRKFYSESAAPGIDLEDIDGLRAHLDCPTTPRTNSLNPGAPIQTVCISPRKGWSCSSNRGGSHDRSGDDRQ